MINDRGQFIRNSTNFTLKIKIAHNKTNINSELKYFMHYTAFWTFTVEIKTCRPTEKSSVGWYYPPKGFTN